MAIQEKGSGTAIASIRPTGKNFEAQLFCALAGRSIVCSGLMILFCYPAVHPRSEIISGVVTLLSLLIVLVLAESFDSFSVGKRYHQPKLRAFKYPLASFQMVILNLPTEYQALCRSTFITRCQR